MSESAKVLFANESFYAAFRNRDAEAMEALWAKQASPSCVHPGWRPLHDLDSVMTSWRGILANSETPQIEARAPRVNILGDTALVVCYEVLGKGCLVATNVFVKESGQWRMLHHHAGPCQDAAPPPDDDSFSTSVQ